jgi:AcrR family transcriptional regulator
MPPVTAPTPARPYHHGALRAALIDAGLALLEEGADLTLRAAARRAGVSHTAPYNHFADKDALLAAIAVRGFEELKRATEAGRDAGGAAAGDRLAAAGRAYVRFAVDRPALYRLMFGPRRAAGAEAVRAAGAAAFDVLVAVIADGMASGAFRQGEARAAAFTAWALVHGVAQLAIDRTGPVSADDPASLDGPLRAAHETMMHGLAAQRPTDPDGGREPDPTDGGVGSQ